MRSIWIALGGALGTLARHGLTTWMLQRFGTAFPWGTLSVNVLGSFLIGALMHVGLASELVSPGMRVTLATGVLGGFTTFSTFSYESVAYLRQGSYALAFWNIAGSLLSCLVACFLGHACARTLLGK